MKIEKKMATLLAAILIAMMGVMPALAPEPSASVPLSVTVERLYVYRITLVSGTGDFGTVFQESSASLSEPIVLEIESPGLVIVGAELRATYPPLDILTTGLFYDWMKPNVNSAGETDFVAFSITHPANTIGTYSIEATIYVPSDYAVGTETATLVFWMLPQG